MSVLKKKDGNLVLIGMPGAGKSTVGVVLAKHMGMRFLDSDLCIQEEENRRLHEIIAEEGLDAFLEIENRVNASLQVENSVIATGGSVIYGKEAMEHLAETGIIVYLQLPYEEIANRLGDLTKRGVAFQDGQSLLDIYKERVPLYERYAELTIDCHEKTIRDIVAEIAEKIQEQSI